MRSGEAGMHPVAVAARGKGTWNTARRAGAIGTRYGIGAHRMQRRLATMLELVERHGSSATLPIPAAVVARHTPVVARYATFGLEFAVHGLHHVDHTDLPGAEQHRQLALARQTMRDARVDVVGFRAPYLRVNDDTLAAVSRIGFLYDASQAFHWTDELVPRQAAYERALDFYGSRPAEEHPVVPWREGGLIRIPYCLPDDEAVVDRLGLDCDQIAAVWLRVLRATRARGELFTVAVHPERIDACARGVTAVLDAARAGSPSVWIARHDEIARWWRDRVETRVTVSSVRPGWIRVSVCGPAGLTLLVRNVVVAGPTAPWMGDTVRIGGTEVEVEARPRRPFIGVHDSSPDSVSQFLREQGYIVEAARSDGDHACFVQRDRFDLDDRLPLLAQIEGGSFPLLRLGRWPCGAGSALSVTGDVDALTIGDYGSRLRGH
jgi:peptidoglycan/xylan/chitin deacetylase (PgdA/CDA1 family)